MTHCYRCPCGTAYELGRSGGMPVFITAKGFRVRWCVNCRRDLREERRRERIYGRQLQLGEGDQLLMGGPS